MQASKSLLAIVKVMNYYQLLTYHYDIDHYSYTCTNFWLLRSSLGTNAQNAVCCLVDRRRNRLRTRHIIILTEATQAFWRDGRIGLYLVL